MPKVNHQGLTDKLPRPCLDGIMASDIKIPGNLGEALDGPYGGYFSDAVHKEFKNLIHFETFELRQLPPGRKAISCKWTFKVKAKADGTIDKFKAHLMIQGYSQRPGIDFDETFAPVAHQESIRMLLALAAQHGYRLRQIDVVRAFLNGDIDKQVFMKQPPEFVQPGNEDLVCELRKALYGLRQAGLVWNRKFNDFLVKNLGFHHVSADPCIYIIKENDKFIILGLHVDDTLMVHNDNTFCDSIVNKIGAKFEITD